MISFGVDTFRRRQSHALSPFCRVAHNTEVASMEHGPAACTAPQSAIGRRLGAGRQRHVTTTTHRWIPKRSLAPSHDRGGHFPPRTRVQEMSSIPRAWASALKSISSAPAAAAVVVSAAITADSKCPPRIRLLDNIVEREVLPLGKWGSATSKPSGGNGFRAHLLLTRAC